MLDKKVKTNIIKQLKNTKYSYKVIAELNNVSTATVGRYCKENEINRSSIRCKSFSLESLIKEGYCNEYIIKKYKVTYRQITYTKEKLFKSEGITDYTLKEKGYNLLLQLMKDSPINEAILKVNINRQYIIKYGLLNDLLATHDYDTICKFFNKKYFEIIKLAKFGGITLEEMSRKLNIPIPSIRMYLIRNKVELPLTKLQLNNVIKRYCVMILLRKKYNYNDIMKNLRVSSSFIYSVQLGLQDCDITDVLYTIVSYGKKDYVDSILDNCSK